MRDILGTGLLNVDEAVIAILPRKSSLEDLLIKNFFIPNKFWELVINDTGVEDLEQILALVDPAS